MYYINVAFKHRGVYMINVINRKALIQDTNAEAVAAVWSKLRENGIEYEVATKTHTSSFKRMLTQKSNINFNAGGVPSTWMEQSGDYLYIVYVNKNDYERSKEICSL